MNNPKTITLFGAIATVLGLLRVAGGGEAPSPTLALLQWGVLILGLIGLIGGLYLWMRGGDN